MNEREVYNYLKNVSLIDIIQMVSKGVNNISNNEIDVYYTAQDLYDLYPTVFSKYKLNKYIKEENFPVIKNGKDRLFLKSSVEEWLKIKNLLQFDKGF